jgi:hypothetical protein
MFVFGDEQGRLDGTEFVQVMKRRNKVPGYKVRCCLLYPLQCTLVLELIDNFQGP